jgi:hypothetical protein
MLDNTDEQWLGEKIQNLDDIIIDLLNIAKCDFHEIDAPIELDDFERLKLQYSAAKINLGACSFIYSALEMSLQEEIITIPVVQDCINAIQQKKLVILLNLIEKI